jgi:hypothetical protein
MKLSPASRLKNGSCGIAASDGEREPDTRARRICADIIAFSQRLPDFEQ